MCTGFKENIRTGPAVGGTVLFIALPAIAPAQAVSQKKTEQLLYQLHQLYQLINFLVNLSTC